MRIVTISGLDGSGKSTQAELLKKYLESHGKRVFYFHAVNFSVGKLGKGTVSTSSNKSVKKANWLQIKLRKIALVIDSWRFKQLISKLAKEGYDYLISDRYFYDTIINIEYLSKKRFNILSLVSPDISIYLQISPEAIMFRDRVPDQGIDYLTRKKGLYENKIGLWNMKVIDGGKDKNVVFDEIKKYVE
jgi:dTMP kinase